MRQSFKFLGALSLFLPFAHHATAITTSCYAIDKFPIYGEAAKCTTADKPIRAKKTPSGYVLTLYASRLADWNIRDVKAANGAVAAGQTSEYNIVRVIKLPRDGYYYVTITGRYANPYVRAWLSND